MKVKLSEWKIRKRSGKNKGSDTRYKEVTRYRDYIIDKEYKIEEGTILEYKEKFYGDVDYKDSQKHLIGFWYLCVIDRETNEDDFWLQSSKGSRKYMFAGRGKPEDWIWLERGKAFCLFCRMFSRRFDLNLEEIGLNNK